MKKFLTIAFNNKNLRYGFVFFAMVTMAYLGYLYGLDVQKDTYAEFLKSFSTIRENSDKYKYINPLLGSNSAPASDVGIYTNIKNNITSYLTNEERKGGLYAYSFYFRDMNSSLWFGINESVDFSPASLFKLPISLAVYKEAEADPSFLKKMVMYSTDISNANTAVQANSDSILILGQSYSVEQLVQIMLVQSDNGAKNALLSVLDLKYLNQLFAIVSLSNPSSVKSYQVSSKNYALFFRVLYGSSYLNEEHSELLLGYLATSTFRDGIVAGLPVVVPVAHKYGVYEFDEDIDGVKRKTIQLHDCGIVYHLSSPYIFCLMTKGKDEESLYKVISHVSKMIYDNQDTQSDD